jgi:uroporphyrinogen decarboxylase
LEFVWDLGFVIWNLKRIGTHTMKQTEDEFPFLRACRRQQTAYTPIWLMRQAGRYMKEYRTLREKHSFMEMCKTPDIAARVTLQPIERFDLDAAIIFSDILIPLEPMGVGFEFAKGEGPVFDHPLREMKEVERLRNIEPEEDLPFLLEAIRIVRRELEGRVPLIGFAGAPFTLASYLIEGGHSKNYALTKTMMYRNRPTWDALMEKLAAVLIRYLNAQVRAGVQTLQLFDSWVGCLTPSDYEEYVLPFSRKVIEGVDRTVPFIHFATSNSTLLELMKRAGGDVMGLDWRVDIKEAWTRLGDGVAIQGNLDPIVLFGPVSLIEKEVRRILDRAEGRPGHIFNLGHGILPETPIDHVAALVEAVHTYSSK